MIGVEIESEGEVVLDVVGPGQLGDLHEVPDLGKSFVGVPVLGEGDIDARADSWTDEVRSFSRPEIWRSTSSVGRVTCSSTSTGFAFGTGIVDAHVGGIT